MPNTLAHIGIQTLVTRGVVRGADIKWVWAGCILPDLPWIGQRIARALPTDLSPIDIRLFATVQSSLFFCLIMSAALSCLSRAPLRTLAILCCGSLMHLVLDATETKWGNGVVLFAPLDWKLTNFGGIWPESSVVLALTGLGLLVSLWSLQFLPHVTAGLRFPGVWRAGAFTALTTCYLCAPVAFMPFAESADLHYAATLRSVSDRPDRPIEFDRSRLALVGGKAELTSWTGERIELRSSLPVEAGTVSVRGRFIDSQTIEVRDIHQHNGRARDYATMAGLAFVALCWGAWLLKSTRLAFHAKSSQFRNRAFGGSKRK